jgi:hypothetical protein
MAKNIDELITFCKVFAEKGYKLDNMSEHVENIKYKPLKMLLKKLKSEKIPKSKKQNLEGDKLNSLLKKKLMNEKHIQKLSKIMVHEKDCKNYEESLKNLKIQYEAGSNLKLFKFYNTCIFSVSLVNFNKFYEEAHKTRSEKLSKKEIFKKINISDSYARKCQILGKIVMKYPKLKYLNWSFDQFYENRKNILKLLDNVNEENKDIQSFWAGKYDFDPKNYQTVYLSDEYEDEDGDNNKEKDKDKNKEKDKNELEKMDTT